MARRVGGHDFVITAAGGPQLRDQCGGRRECKRLTRRPETPIAATPRTRRSRPRWTGSANDGRAASGCADNALLDEQIFGSTGRSGGGSMQFRCRRLLTISRCCWCATRVYDRLGRFDMVCDALIQQLVRCLLCLFQLIRFRLTHVCCGCGLQQDYELRLTTPAPVVRIPTADDSKGGDSRASESRQAALNTLDSYLRLQHHLRAAAHRAQRRCSNDDGWPLGLGCGVCMMFSPRSVNSTSVSATQRRIPSCNLRAALAIDRAMAIDEKRSARGVWWFESSA